MRPSSPTVLVGVLQGWGATKESITVGAHPPPDKTCRDSCPLSRRLGGLNSGFQLLIPNQAG